jgi:hypothetical protein
MAIVKKRITTLGQVIFIGFAVTVDLVELILDLLLVGIIVNRIIDIIVAGIFFLYALAKGLTIAEDAKVFGSIGGTVIGEFVPGLDIAPFFTIDAWYITHTIKAKDKAIQKAVNETESAINAEQERQEWISNYQQQQQAEAAQIESNPLPSGNPADNSGIIK